MGRCFSPPVARIAPAFRAIDRQGSAAYTARLEHERGLNRLSLAPDVSGVWRGHHAPRSDAMDHHRAPQVSA